MKHPSPIAEKPLNRFYKHFETFTKNTNLHGYRYITDQRLSLFERSIWAITVIASIILCIYFVIVSWIQWNNSRVIVTFDRTASHVWQIPFPAVTICPETKIRQTVYNSSSILAQINSGNLSEENFLVMESLAQVCDNVKSSNLTMMFANDSLLELLKKASVPFNELFYSCQWRKKAVDCNNIFEPILTDRGYCFSFNILAADIFSKSAVPNMFQNIEELEYSRGWTLESGYPKYLPPDTYPRRGTTPGLDGGLSIVLGMNKNDVDYLCGGRFQGFRVSLQSPINMPRMTQQYFMLPFNEQLIVSIDPKMVYTPPELESLSSSKRGCYMDQERKLRYFAIYSSTNCAQECLSNYTLAVCGCVGFYMPRDTSVRICGAGKLDCMKKARMILEERETLFSLHEDPPHSNEFPNFCNCLSGCTFVEYDETVSRTSSDAKNTVENFDLKKNPEEVFLATIRIYFSDAHFIAIKRAESFGFAQLLGNIGGMISLFTGFSVLTFVEITYYVVIRPAILAIRERTKNNSKEINDNENN